MASLKDLMDVVNSTSIEEELARAIMKKIAQNIPDLTDYTPSSPHVVISEANAYGAALMLYYAERSPEIMEEWVIRNLFGASELPAQPAKANLVLTFSTPAPSSGRTIIAGTGFKTASELVFVLDSDYTYPAGTYGNEMANGEYLYQIPVVCLTPGSSGNVAADSITTPTQSIVDLVSVTNPEPSYGGTDEETYDEMRVRVFSQPLDNILVSQLDYENAVKQFLGGGAVYVISPKLLGVGSNDDPNWQPGKVRLAIIYPDGTPLSSNPSLQADLESRSPLAPVEFIAPEIISVDIDVSVDFDSNLTNSSDLDNAVRAALAEYLNPISWEYWGKIPNKVYRSELIALIQDLTGVVSVTLNAPSADIDLRPSGWTVDSPYAAPKVGTITTAYTAVI